MNWDAFWSSTVGALIGSAIALLATFQSHRLTQQAEKTRGQEATKRLLQAIHDEVEATWRQYMASIGESLEALEDGKPFSCFWPIHQDYFTIYNTNAGSIGIIADAELRRLIVQTYAKGRGLIDSFRFNNQLLQSIDEAICTMEDPHPAKQLKYVEERLGMMSQYGRQLRRSHYEMKANVVELLAGIQRIGILRVTG